MRQRSRPSDQFRGPPFLQPLAAMVECVARIKMAYLAFCLAVTGMIEPTAARVRLR